MSRFIAICALVSAALFFLPAQAYDRQAVETILRSPERDLGDKMKDALTKPLEVLAFLGIEEGMQVLDLYAAGGYYSLILAKAVGEQGSVFAQNSPRALAFQEDRTDITAGEAIARKIATHELENVVRMDKSLADINLLPNSLDAVMVSKIFHDYYNRDPRRGHQLLLTVKAALKPGGVIGLIDHHGDPGKDNRRFHRIPKQDVLNAIERAGLIVEADSDLLRVRGDTRQRSIFDPLLNGNTDRFLLRIRKPE